MTNRFFMLLMCIVYLMTGAAIASEQEAYERLEKIQEWYCQQTQARACALDEADLRRTLEELYEGLKATAPQMFPETTKEEFVDEMIQQAELYPSTKFDMVGHGYLFHKLYEAAAGAMELMGAPVTNKPAMGALEAGQINALTINFQGLDRKAIAFNSEVFELAHEISKTVIDTIPKRRSEDGVSLLLEYDEAAYDQFLDQNPQLEQYFVELVLEFMGFGAISHRYAEEYTPFSDALRDGLELFVLGHELGHVQLEHEGKLVPLSTYGSVSYASNLATAKEWDWMPEIEADVIGSEIVQLVALEDDLWDTQMSHQILLAGSGAYFFLLYDLIEASSIVFLQRDLACIQPTEDEAVAFWEAVDHFFTFRDGWTSVEYQMDSETQRSHPPTRLRLELQLELMNSYAEYTGDDTNLRFQEAVRSRVMHLARRNLPIVAAISKDLKQSSPDDWQEIANRAGSYVKWCQL